MTSWFPRWDRIARATLAGLWVVASGCDGSGRPEARQAPEVPEDARPSEAPRPPSGAPSSPDDPPRPPAFAGLEGSLLPPPDEPRSGDGEPVADDDLAELEAALRDPDPEIRRQAVEVVMPRPEAEPLLLVALRDPDPEVRAAVADGLAFLESDGARRGVLWALRDPDPVVVLAAIDALEMLAAPGDVAALRPLALGGAPEVRARASTVLARLDVSEVAHVDAGEEWNHGQAAAVDGPVR